MLYGFLDAAHIVLLVVFALALAKWGIRLYYAALPKPIPGIPYKRSSAGRLLGDMFEAMKYLAETAEVYSYLSKTAAELNEPIFQMFMRPFSKPWVIVADFRESYDILFRRTKEFDRADIHREVFGPLMPNSHVTFATDELWSSHRRLIDGAMSGPFIADVGTPCAYNASKNLVDLWKEKLRLAPGKPFDAKGDADRFSTDFIWTFVFGDEIDATGVQASNLSMYSSLPLRTGHTGLVSFPEVADPDAFRSLRKLCETLEIPVKSPLPRLHYWFVLHAFPSIVKARLQKEKQLGELLERARKRFERSRDKIRSAKSVIDLVVRKESDMAIQAGREMEHDTRVIRDELFALLFGGLGTATKTVHWMLKYMTEDQRVQQHLRSELRSKFPRAREYCEDPTASEIVEASMPYLEAVLAEIRRHSCAIPAHARMATVDTTLLGHFIPKGTTIFVLNNGPSILTPAIPVEDSKRSETAQSLEDKTGTWNDSDIGTFLPERWLIRNEEGELEFNPWAGPSLPFGGGIRGCFGRKLVFVKQRILLTLILWNFELLPLSKELVSDKTVDDLTHGPKQVSIRLAAAA